MCFKIYHLDPAKFVSTPWLAWEAALKKTEVKAELLTDIDMLLMVEKGVRAGIFHAIHQNAKVNNKYKEEYDKNKELSYLKYRDVNNLYGWAMSQELPVNIFKWIKVTFQFNEDFIKSCNEENDEGYFLEIDFQYPEKLHELDNDLQFLSEGMDFEKVKKIVTNLHDKIEYAIYIRNLKQALNHLLVLKKVRRVVKLNQKAWLKPYIDMNTKLRKTNKKSFWERFL